MVFLVGAAQELKSYPNNSKLGKSSVSKPICHGTLTILCLHPTMLPFTTVRFFTDKKEVLKSAAAMGYIAHAVSLIASCLHVPLRYPLHLGGSHSYVNDNVPQ